MIGTRDFGLDNSRGRKNYDADCDLFLNKYLSLSGHSENITRMEAFRWQSHFAICR